MHALMENGYAALELTAAMGENHLETVFSTKVASVFVSAPHSDMR